MRKAFLRAALLAALWVVVGGAGSEGRAQPYSRKSPIVEAVSKTRASIVTVKIEKRNNGGRSGKSVGTGVIIDDRGYVVTNRHVIAAAARVFTCLVDGTELEAEVVVADAQYDLAILKVQAGSLLPALHLGDATDLMVGETVIAIGHPYGYENTVSTGIVSALGREITMPAGDVLGNLIQTNASINPGNSGGPLLNINGELIGINVALREGAQGIAFAINAETVKKVLNRNLPASHIASLTQGPARAE